MRPFFKTIIPRTRRRWFYFLRSPEIFVLPAASPVLRRRAAIRLGDCPAETLAVVFRLTAASVLRRRREVMLLCRGPALITARFFIKLFRQNSRMDLSLTNRVLAYQST
jgi:hypothetical protein